RARARHRVHVPARAGSLSMAGARRVILLHGLWMPGASMHWLSLQLRDAGFAPEVFGYHSVADGPDLAVPRLVELLQGGGEADIVAHSLGGLIALQALRDAPDLPVRSEGRRVGKRRRCPWTPAAA